jgi:excinuclease ABC subunit B
VSLVAIFDADRQGFLRNERSLLQTIGRAARNQNGKVLLYADGFSPAMEAAIRQTLERRQRQQANNEMLGITPRTIVKALPVMGDSVEDLISGTTTSGGGSKRLIAKKGGRKDGDWAQRLKLGAGSWTAAHDDEKPIEDSNSQLTYDEPHDLPATLSEAEREDLVNELRDEMEMAAKNLDFEQAARLRDRIHELERWQD